MRLLKSSLLSLVALVFGLIIVPTEEASAQYPLEVAERNGLTLMVNVGPGFQHDALFESSATGLGRISVGIGDFLSDDLGVFLRFSATQVEHTDGLFPQRQTSGFGGFSMQFWQNSRFFIETGLGVGFTAEELTERTHAGISALIGTGVALYRMGNSHVHFGVEYSPVVINRDLVHTVGLNIGYQLF